MHTSMNDQPSAGCVESSVVGGRVRLVAVLERCHRSSRPTCCTRRSDAHLVPRPGRISMFRLSATNQLGRTPRPLPPAGGCPMSDPAEPIHRPGSRSPHGCITYDKPDRGYDAPRWPGDPPGGRVRPASVDPGGFPFPGSVAQGRGTAAAGGTLADEATMRRPLAAAGSPRLARPVPARTMPRRTLHRYVHAAIRARSRTGNRESGYWGE